MVHNSVAVPHNVPLFEPKETPLGREALISHEVISPEPVMVGTSGRSLLTVLFVSVMFSGVYVMLPGNSSTTVMLK